MSTISSPRPSLGVRIPSSARSSLSIERGTPINSRRNRAALRDYYKIKTNIADEGTHNPNQAIQDQGDALVEASELDAPDFDAVDYVHTALSRSSLAEVLQAEAGLVSAIRGLDGERKALVYDNYSRLIAATDTIARMRTDIGPLAPEVAGRIGPAVEDILASAGGLARTLDEKSGLMESEFAIPAEDSERRKENERITVRWVLSAPRRLASMIDAGEREEAVSDWKDIETLLELWKEVGGTQELKRQCQDIMEDL